MLVSAGGGTRTHMPRGRPDLRLAWHTRCHLRQENWDESDRRPPRPGCAFGDPPHSAPGRIRTCDRLLRRQLLCPLSYGDWGRGGAGTCTRSTGLKVRDANCVHHTPWIEEQPTGIEPAPQAWEAHVLTVDTTAARHVPSRPASDAPCARPTIRRAQTRAFADFKLDRLPGLAALIPASAQPAAGHAVPKSTRKWRRPESNRRPRCEHPRVVLQASFGGSILGPAVCRLDAGAAAPLRLA